jgi:hypothetical protein
MSKDAAWRGVVDPDPALFFLQARQILRFDTGVMGKDELDNAAAISDEGKTPFLDQRYDSLRGLHAL